MKISTRGRYSLRLMLDLAQHYDEGFIALKDISARQNISKKYLEQIIPFLTRNNLIVTNRGHMGGSRLARHPSEITAYEIILSAEGSISPVSCLENDVNSCEYADSCLTLPIYSKLGEVVKEYLSSITLQDILDRNL